MVSTTLKRPLLVMFAVSLWAGCTPPPSEETVPGRWYTAEQVERGRTTFQTQCAHCHGTSAEGTSDWRKVDATGNFPPPPLNGSAHAWHHPLPILEKVIAKGGVPLGGSMPGFANVLSTDEVRETITYFQSLWSDETYARWAEMDGR